MREERWRSGAQPRPAAASRGRARAVAAAVLAVLGLAAAGSAFVGIAMGIARSVQPLREASASVTEQRFTFDRSAWRAVALDDVFPPVAHAVDGGAIAGSARDYTRIGVAPAATCRAAFDPGLARLLSVHPCGPVLRVDYTDETRTMVATVGLVVLGTSPAEEADMNADTLGHHDDLRPRALAFPGTPAAGFGDPQRVAFHVLASPNAPILDFAAVGFSDGRTASADPGLTASEQSGAQSVAADLADQAGARIEKALSNLWDGQR